MVRLRRAAALERLAGGKLWGQAVIFCRPGARLRPHCGPTNLRLRVHVGLSVPDGAGMRVGDVVVGIGGKAAPSTVHGCILKLKAAEGTCVVAVTRKGAAAAEEIKAQSVRRASQVAAAAAAREAHIRTLKAKRMSELTKDLSAYNAARAQAT